MNIPTYEQVVQEFHRQTFYYKNGSYPRPIVNFETTKYNKNKHLFEKFIKSVERNYGHINWSLMIESLGDFFKGYFNPMFLSNAKGIKIYKNYIRERQTVKTENIEKEVKRSIKNVLSFIAQDELRDVDEYLTQGQYLLPTIAKHLSGGTISPYFLVMVPDIKSIINSFGKDMKDEYFADFLENYDIFRAKAIKTPSLRNLSDNFYRIVNKYIQ